MPRESVIARNVDVATPGKRWLGVCLIGGCGCTHYGANPTQVKRNLASHRRNTHPVLTPGQLALPLAV